jgi:hypothetical protein
MMEVKGAFMKTSRYWLPLLFLSALSCTGKQLSTSVYDEKADAHHDIAVAIANAQKGNKNVVLIFGANW